MEWWSLIKKDLCILVLLGVANSAPILARVLMGKRFSTPVDIGLTLWDGRRLFGGHKTFRGILASLIITSIASQILGLGLLLGARLSLLSMGGDLASSFVKRRMGLQSGKRATGIDQVPEALFPLLVLRQELGLDYQEIFYLVALFFILEVFISPLLYAIRIRRAPY